MKSNTSSLAAGFASQWEPLEQWVDSQDFLYAGAAVSMDSPRRSCEPVPLFPPFQLGRLDDLESDRAARACLIEFDDLNLEDRSPEKQRGNSASSLAHRGG
jgi:hypothetical protein